MSVSYRETQQDKPGARKDHHYLPTYIMDIGMPCFHLWTRLRQQFGSYGVINDWQNLRLAWRCIEIYVIDVFQVVHGPDLSSRTKPVIFTYMCTQSSKSEDKILAVEIARWKNIVMVL